MAELYKTVIALCEQRGITGYRLCKDIGISPNTITELRKGRRNGVSANTLAKIAEYFNVSVEYLLGTETKNPATENSDGDLTDAQRELIAAAKTMTENEAAALLAAAKILEANRDKDRDLP